MNTDDRRTDELESQSSGLFCTVGKRLMKFSDPRAAWREKRIRLWADLMER